MAMTTNAHNQVNNFIKAIKFAPIAQAGLRHQMGDDPNVIVKFYDRNQAIRKFIERQNGVNISDTNAIGCRYWTKQDAAKKGLCAMWRARQVCDASIVNIEDRKGIKQIVFMTYPLKYKDGWRLYMETYSNGFQLVVPFMCEYYSLLDLEKVGNYRNPHQGSKQGNRKAIKILWTTSKLKYLAWASLLVMEGNALSLSYLTTQHTITIDCDQLKCYTKWWDDKYNN
jgi:hypothetical protein